MHRRILSVRRFGEMSFGLGYFEDGVWIDHSTDDGRAEETLTPPDRTAMDAVHAWYTCCVEPADDAAPVIQLPIALLPDDPSTEIGPRLRTARRPASASSR